MEAPKKQNLLWSSYAHDRPCDNDFQLQPGWTIFFPFNSLDYRNENSKLSRHGSLSKQVSGIHFDLPGIELKEPPNTVCYGSLRRNKVLTFHFAYSSDLNSSCDA